LSLPLEQETEITGPMALKVPISSSTVDADLFVTVQAFSPDGREVEFQGTVDPHTPLAQGWLRASHRKLDPARSKPWQPYYTHDDKQPVKPGWVYDVDVEIWPTCIILPRASGWPWSSRARTSSAPARITAWETCPPSRSQPPEARIEQVAERVADQIDGQHDEENREAGERGHPPR